MVRFLFFLFLSAVAAWAAPARPNIVLFIADDHGVDFLGCYGNPAIHTPHLDALAKQGWRGDRVFAGSPTCSPSRSIIFTGLHSARNGAMGNHTDCRPELKSLPVYLQALGYRVVAANKTDVRPDSVFTWEMLEAALPKNPAHPRRYRGEGLDTVRVDAFLASHAREHPEQPLCLLLGDSCPHVTWEPNRDYDPATLPIPPFLVDTPVTRQALANYYQDITTADQHLGEVVASLDRYGFAANTLLIYTSDQGPEWPHCKWTCYDTGLRVPFLARWPGMIQPGSSGGALLSLVDLTPTLVELAGGTPPTGLDGRPFREAFLGRAAHANDYIFASHTGDGTMNVFPQRCVRDERYKLILNLLPENQWTTHFTKVMDIPGSHGQVYRTWVEKAETDPATAHFIQTLEHHPRVELYDTETDPYELHNLAAEASQAGRLGSLKARLQEWLQQQSDVAAIEAMQKP